jgi:hypothetical protein
MTRLELSFETTLDLDIFGIRSLVTGLDGRGEVIVTTS